MAERAYGERRAKPRKKKTLFCRLEFQGRSFPAVVLDVSASGLFVGTAISAPRGTKVEVTLRMAGGKTWHLPAEIARDVQPGSGSDRIHNQGVGLRITNVPDGFADFVESLKPDGWHSQ